MDTTTEYVTAVREILQEPEAQVWTDAQLIRYLNWAKDIIWRRFTTDVQGDWYITVGSAFSLVKDTQEYALPSGMIRFVAAEWVYNSTNVFMEKIPRRLRERYEGVIETVTPSEYVPGFYLAPPYIGILPTPQVDIASAVRIHYIAKLSDMTAGGNWTTFEDYAIPELERLTVLRAAMMAKNLDETVDAGLVTEYKIGLAELIHDYSQGGEQEEYRQPDADEYLWQ